MQEQQGGFNVQVPIGFRVSAIQEEHIIYRAVGYIGVLGGSHTYDMECERQGEIGNGYTGQLLPIDYAQGLTSAMLTTILSAGTEEESDNALRARLLNVIQKPSTSGNRYDYYNWAMECEGVGAAKVFPLANGCRTDFADIQNKKECGGNRQWQNHYLRKWAANTKSKGIT